jgi:hypothetical protein
MRVIYKYTLQKLYKEQVLKLPVARTLLSISEQHGNIAMWYEVDTHEPEGGPTKVTGVAFQCFETGDQVPDGWQYMGTVLFDGGSYVLHVYSK